jgi:hypothetical protein
MNLFSRIAQAPEFATFMAHAGFAYFCVHQAVAHGTPMGYAMAAGAILAGFKEFWIDIRYEDNPPQTFEDGIEDFAGYAVGIGLGAMI